MKNSIFAIFSLAIALTIFSCEKENPMVGLWQTTSAKIESAGMDSNMAILIEEEYKRFNITINADGTVAVAGVDQPSTGTYTLDEAAKTFKIASMPEDPNPWTMEYTIVSKSDTEMTLSQPIDKRGGMATLVLQKQVAAQ